MSTKPKMTPWFVNGEKPARKGVYNVSCRKRNQTGKWFSLWDGIHWHVAHKTAKSAQRDRERCYGDGIWHISGSWRGLASKP